MNFKTILPFYANQALTERTNHAFAFDYLNLKFARLYMCVYGGNLKAVIRSHSQTQLILLHSSSEVWSINC